MARRRTLNYRDFRNDFDESEEGRRKREEGESEEVEEVDDEEEDEDEEEASDEEGDDEEASDEEGDDDEEAPVKKKPVKKEKPKKAPAKPRAKKSKGKSVRVRVVWGVFNNSNQPVATYDFTRKQDAIEHATRLQTDKKQTHFIQPVKQPIVEEK